MLKKATWPLYTLSTQRRQINTNPDYQRPAVWTRAQKQLLIDSILREYDVPKIYLHEVSKNAYDVIDRQQRIRAICSYYDNEFSLPKDADPVNGYDVANLNYSDLPMDVATIINSYTLDFVILDNEDEDEIREMFLRLQNGTSLKAQEKRNAMPGKMRNFVKEIAKHDFFNKVNFSNARFTFDLIAAQMCLLCIEKKICNIKDKDLNVMYEEYRSLDVNSSEARTVIKILNYLNEMFKSKAPELKRYSVISLFILLMDMMPNYNIRGRENDIADWFIRFESNRAIDETKPPEEQDPRLVIYHERISNSSDTMDSLTYRHTLLKESLISEVPDLPQKDPKRTFDEAQRQVIFRRDRGICQVCKKECEWNDWEADHIVPWSNGGKTSIENGQVLCPACNSRKCDNMY